MFTHISILVGGLEHVLFSHILEIIIPVNLHIFQSGGSTTNQYIYIYIYNYIYISRSHRRSTGWMIFTHISIDCPAVRFSLKGDPCRAWSIHWRPGRWIWGITAIVAGWWTTSISSSVIQGGSEVFLSDAQNYCYIYIMIYIYIYMYIWFICIWFICICVYIYILLLYCYTLFMYGYIWFLYDMLW